MLERAVAQLAASASERDDAEVEAEAEGGIERGSDDPEDV